eukprot:scaffold2496_cov72-Skeletonema_dohrnii-CCMP3373.AAC.1
MTAGRSSMVDVKLEYLLGTGCTAHPAIDSFERCHMNWNVHSTNRRETRTARTADFHLPHPYHRGKGATREKEKTPACPRLKVTKKSVPSNIPRTAI